MTVCTKYTRVVCPFDIEKTITLSYFDNIDRRHFHWGLKLVGPETQNTKGGPERLDKY